MRLGESLHALEGAGVKFQWQVEGLGYRFVCNVIVALEGHAVQKLALNTCNITRGSCQGCVGEGVYGRWPNASAGHNEVVVVAHPPHGFNDLVLIIGDDFNPLELNTKREAVFSEEGRIGVDGLELLTSESC